MGRKIPGKKHRGVKDPLEQIARRNESLKLKLNAPPSNPDAQEMPKKVAELGRLITLAKEGKLGARKKKRRNKGLIDVSRAFAKPQPKNKGKNQAGTTQSADNCPKLVQRPGETEEKFLERIDDATEDLINEAKFQEEYYIDTEKDESQKGDDIESDEDNINLYKIRKPFKKKATKKTGNNGTEKRPKRLNRRQKMKLKKALRKEEEGFSKFTDCVKFGEVVQQPPQLTARPKGTTSTKFAKPGSKNLLLKNLMANGKGTDPPKPKLSVVARRNLEAQREAAVAAYRLMKAKGKQLKQP
ncbi:hypothetical protein AAG570_005528 [Ranatra chinensis]|uniref:Coiled-coil domain-containing protein 137 n=1 Tax=Ranatra chinensis TaxID=642074 RepID=A0ABD0XY18_9HEMI